MHIFFLWFASFNSHWTVWCMLSSTLISLYWLNRTSISSLTVNMEYIWQKCINNDISLHPCLFSIYYYCNVPCLSQYTSCTSQLFDRESQTRKAGGLVWSSWWYMESRPRMPGTYYKKSFFLIIHLDMYSTSAINFTIHLCYIL